ncbi:MAG: UDP-N-acetylmuramate--L-alanine ligase [Nitrospinae bacterium]|nr:UDP-N-acetylmuramate--L-alanine ligase [Nitrospinota bacterium]
MNDIKRFGRTKTLHFVGIGGSGMSGVAEILLNMGYAVTGSDLSDSEAVRHLRNAGAKIEIGHAAANVGDADVVVVSSAVRADNPEVVEAKGRLIPVIPRAEMLAELMRMKHSVAVAGAHGKTTTTSMTAVTLARGGFDPTIIIGGRVDRFGSGAKLGQGDFLVAEADESDGSFLKLYPTIAIVTNIDAEHLDHYGSFEKIKDAFVEFINKTPFYGVTALCLDDAAVQEIIPRITKRFRTFGINSTADLTARDIKFSKFNSSFTVALNGKEIGRVNIAMPGVHNVYNALAAMSVGLELSMEPADIVAALDGFRGVQRRCQVKGEVNGVMVIDDYGHHPNEIRATLRAIKEGFADRRLIVVFQPHRYTRTRDQMDEFHKSFYDADELLITEIYAASEQPIEGVSGELIARGAAAHGKKRVKFTPDLDSALNTLLRTAAPGDIVLTLGAGSVTTLGDRFLMAYPESGGK